jgi:hypothetical protein
MGARPMRSRAARPERLLRRAFNFKSTWLRATSRRRATLAHGVRLAAPPGAAPEERRRPPGTRPCPRRRRPEAPGARVQLTSVQVTHERDRGENVLAIRLRYNIISANVPENNLLVPGVGPETGETRGLQRSSSPAACPGRPARCRIAARRIDRSWALTCEQLRDRRPVTVAREASASLGWSLGPKILSIPSLLAPWRVSC